mgnify:CR=1 FL=1
MRLNDLNAKVGPKPDRHRVGRGPGSGWGCTAGRGRDGAKSRSGFSRSMHFDGGQMSFIRRIPKRGFTNAPFRKEFATVNLGCLQQAVDAKKLDVSKPVDAEALTPYRTLSQIRAGV